MDIPKLLFNLREEASCLVCQDILRDPRYLPCLHSFCLNCLINWHRASGGQVDLRCPKCQVRCTVPASGDLKDLPTSFFLSGFIDALAIKESDKTRVTCGNCEKKSSKTSYCFECCKFYCDECLIGHNIWRGYKDHRVLAVKDFQEKDYEVVVKRPVFCARKGHEKEELKFFCKICPENSVCQNCVTLDHAGHKVTLIREEAEAQKIELAGLTETPKTTLKAKMKLVTQIDEKYAQLVQRSELLTNVDIFVDNLMWRLQEERQNIKSAVENETKKSLENLTTKNTAIQHEMKEIESALKKAEKLLTQSTDAEVVQLKKPLQTILERAGQFKPVERDPENLSELFFEENNKILETINSGGIGLLKFRSATNAKESVAEGKGLYGGTVGREAQFNLTTRNAAAEQCYSKKDNVTVDLRDERGQESKTTFVVNDNKDGTYKISYSPTFRGKCNLSVKVNGQHIRGSPFCVVIIKSFNVKPVLSFGKQGSNDGMFIYPRGVAVNSRDEIAVTSWHKVQIFDRKGNFLRSFGRQGSDKGQFQCPTGIAFGKDRNIYVADSGNNRIQIFNEEERYMSMFGGKGSLDSQLQYPYGLSLDSNGNIIVAGSSNQFINFFSPDGNFLTKIGGPSSLSDPVHCVQSGNYLIVSDCDDHSVKVFTWEGYYKYQFGTRGKGNGEFTFPYCLSVTKSGHVLVCDWVNHRVQVFELNGKFVGKFGKKGSNLGEFKNPFSVAPLSNGQIVVSDCWNHRIQIFDET